MDTKSCKKNETEVYCLHEGRFPALEIKEACKVVEEQCIDKKIARIGLLQYTTVISFRGEVRTEMYI